jgi:hypothetical protein
MAEAVRRRWANAAMGSARLDRGKRESLIIGKGCPSGGTLRRVAQAVTTRWARVRPGGMPELRTGHARAAHGDS